MREALSQHAGSMLCRDSTKKAAPGFPFRGAQSCSKHGVLENEVSGLVPPGPWSNWLRHARSTANSSSRRIRQPWLSAALILTGRVGSGLGAIGVVNLPLGGRGGGFDTSVGPVGPFGQGKVSSTLVLNLEGVWCMLTIAIVGHVSNEGASATFSWYH